MILFFARGKVDSDKFIKYCYGYYRNIMYDAALPANVNIIREDRAKPRFDADGVYFNLSHSHGVTLLGISHTPIGVDIEKIRDIDYKKFSFIDAGCQKEFFQKWTERESYAKLTGEGLAAIKKPVPADAHFEHFDVFDGYHACIAAEEQNLTAYEMDVSMIE